jgi:hypothetical protein
MILKHPKTDFAERKEVIPGKQKLKYAETKEEILYK